MSASDLSRLRVNAEIDRAAKRGAALHPRPPPADVPALDGRMLISKTARRPAGALLPHWHRLDFS
eukprot:6411909-Pyramimonas_sp.AAC.1